MNRRGFFGVFGAALVPRPKMMGPHEGESIIPLSKLGKIHIEGRIDFDEDELLHGITEALRNSRIRRFEYWKEYGREHEPAGVVRVEDPA